MSSQKKSNQVKSDKTESKLDKNDKLSESPEPTISIPENDFGEEHVAKDLESKAKHIAVHLLQGPGGCLRTQILPRRRPIRLITPLALRRKCFVV